MNEQRYLNSIRIRFCDYWENKDKYTWEVEFKNWEKNSFSFNVWPEIANRYIELISEDVVKWASELWNKLKQSLVEQWLYKSD